MLHPFVLVVATGPDPKRPFANSERVEWGAVWRQTRSNDNEAPLGPFVAPRSNRWVRPTTDLHPDLCAPVSLFGGGEANPLLGSQHVMAQRGRYGSGPNDGQRFS